MKSIVLVYSGGLDTSICIPLLREEYGYDRLVTVTIDVGQPKEDIEQASTKASALKTEHVTIDAKEQFAKEFCFKALAANANYEGYPLSTAIARPLIALKAVEVAKRMGITAFAHGCTGKGNDQFRIEFGIRVLMPEATIHAPIRERNLTRSWEIEYAKKKNVPIQQSLEKIWSVDENLWGRSIEGGRLEDPDYTPPEEIYHWTESFAKSPNQPQEITISFEKGIPVALNGENLPPVKMIQAANTVAGKNGIGRIDIMEDRILGLKVRENYECPGATLLITAHQALEALVLTQRELKFKKTVESEWAQLAYEGLWFDPYKASLETFLFHTQERVTGDVRLRLFKGNAQTIGRKSPWALYSKELASFDSTDFDQREHTGTVRHFGLQARLYQLLQQKIEK